MTARNPSLDLLRGLAITMVVLTHCSHTATSIIPGLRYFSFHYGELGVQLFFIVSGYTMMLTFGETTGLASARSFYLRRAFRIVPLFWIAILFYLMLPRVEATRVWAPDGIGIGDVVLNFLFLQWTRVTAFNSIVPGGWSIAVEMQFYLLFPLLIYVFRKRNGPLFCYAVIAALTVVARFASEHLLIPQMAASLPANQGYLAEAFYFWWLPNQMICFGFGMLLYDYIELNNRPTIGTLLLLGSCLSSIFGCQVVTLATISFAVLALNLKSSLMSLLGRHSYAIYLVHFAFVWALAALISIDLFVMFVLVTAASLAVSYFVTGPLVERRCNRLGHALAARVRDSAPATVTAT
jgi:peptidoglycan/LPS O-acetylase OafA/YrhL